MTTVYHVANVLAELLSHELLKNFHYEFRVHIVSIVILTRHFKENNSNNQLQNASPLASESVVLKSFSQIIANLKL